jgi:hypothetical protein
MVVTNKLLKAFRGTFGMQPHMPAMKEHLIQWWSKEATGHDKSWDDTSNESIDWWRHYESKRNLKAPVTKGWTLPHPEGTIGLVRLSSTYPMANASRYPSTPTTTFPQNDDYKLLTTERMDWAMVCMQPAIWEDTTHMLTTCLGSCDAHCVLARKSAWVIFQHTRIHIPDILTHLIWNSMDSWLARRPVLPPAWNGPKEPIQWQSEGPSKLSLGSGGDQFFHQLQRHGKS